LQATVSRVDQKVATLASTEAAINSRVGALSAAAKKETAERKKSIDSQVKDLNQKLQLLTILPLLIQTPTATVKPGTLLDSASQPIPKVAVPDSSNFNLLLPLLLMGGLGGTGSGGGLGLGGDSGGSDGSLPLLALVLAFANKP